MKVFVIILKVLMMIATGVIAVVLNILGLISLITNQTTDVSSIIGILIFWISFFAMLKKYFICGTLTFVGLICVLILHEMLPGDPGYLYMPLLIITVLGILLAIFGNWDKIHGNIEKREKEKNKAAPSVLGGTTAPADEVVSKKAAKKRAKAKK